MMLRTDRARWLLPWLALAGGALLLHALVTALSVSPVLLHLPLQPAPARLLDERFLSFGIDTSGLAGGVDRLRLDSPRLQRLTALLRPSRLRIGGTMADRLIFMEDPAEAQTDDKPIGDTKFLPYFTMDGEDLLKIIKFSLRTDARLLFDFNALIRNGDDWDPTNAIQLLEFVNKLNVSDEIDWQLGNEPNSFRHVFNVTVPAEQLSRDFAKLRSVLKQMAPYSLLVGPDTTRPQPHQPNCLKYMVEFLQSFNTTRETCNGTENCALKNGAVSDYVDAVAWHQYYLSSRVATVDDFWNPEIYDLLQSQINTMRENIDGLRGDVPMWLTETSSTFGGGTPGLSNRFSSSPMWLDKLGLAAREGIDVVVRQSLIGANYSMIDEDLDPLPDWWVSFLHKRFVGKEVISCNLNESTSQRFYCHCASKYIPRVDGSGTVTIFGINTAKSHVYIRLEGSGAEQILDIDEYLLTSDELDSKHIFLNGKLLKYEDRLPEILPKKVKYNTILMPGFSLGFWVLHDANMPACA